jgi:hypothetical protein
MSFERAKLMRLKALRKEGGNFTGDDYKGGGWRFRIRIKNEELRTWTERPMSYRTREAHPTVGRSHFVKVDQPRRVTVAIPARRLVVTEMSRIRVTH